VTAHVGEDGLPCALHPEPSQQRILELALIGSRMPGFHHDAASKLQTLMMALDEISELSAEATPMLSSALDTAHDSLRELHQLLRGNRALATPSQRANVRLADLVTAASERVGVKLRGQVPTIEVCVAIAAMTHALAQLFDLAAGVSELGRIVDLVIESGEQLILTITGPREATQGNPAAPEIVALTAFVLEREQGTLVCSGDGERFRVHLPRSARTAQPPESL
jgi:hypothetical protein